MAAFKKVFSNRPVLGALLFAFALLVSEEFLFDFPQAKFFQFTTAFLKPNEIWIALFSVIASFLFSYYFVWAALRSSYFLQVLYTILLTVSSLVQYGYWRAVDRFLISADIKIATATPIDTWKGASTLFFDWRSILPVLGFVFLLLMFSQREAWKPSLLKLGAVLALMGVLALSHTFTNQPLGLGASLPSFYQTIARFIIDHVSLYRREVLTYEHPEKPMNNIVLIIDESIRGDHLSINGYERDTTPFLRKLAHTEEDFHSFGLAVAGATCSYSSNALVLTGVRPGQDEFILTESYPTIFQYAKTMGYKTYYMDAQTNSFWNGLTNQDMSSIDSWVKARDLGDDIKSDFRAADRIVEIVSQGSGNFIVLNKRGVHFLYEDSYPREAAVWLPLPGDYFRNPDLVSNSYDNGVLYNVNTFFKQLLIDPGVLQDTVILYTSDHGQTLFENEVSWLHCNSTIQEATVPLILIGRNLPSITNTTHPSHSTILPTLLDLMAVPESQRLHPYSASLFSDTGDVPNSRYFFDGSLRLVPFPDM